MDDENLLKLFCSNQDLLSIDFQSFCPDYEPVRDLLLFFLISFCLVFLM